jgi:photosystem II stability/assembly factor-like uncharacterized protein
MNNYLFTWGSNDNSRLNIPEPFGVITSGVVSGAFSTKNVYLGLRHGIIEKNNKTYVGWGDNSFGQLDFNPLIEYTSPDLGMDTTYFIDTSLGAIHGYGHDLIFTDLLSYTGQIVNWSHAKYFNNGNLAQQSIYSYPRGFSQVKSGPGYLIARKSNGTITGWGDSTNPAISGVNWSQINNSGYIKDIAAGTKHVIILYSNGKIYGWGDNLLGQLDFDKKYLFSGVKISSKLDHNLAIGLRSPISTGILRNGNNWIITYTQTGENISGVLADISADGNNWTGFYNQYPDTPTQLIVPTNLTSNKNYFIRLKERSDTFCINTGWQNKVRAQQFYDIAISYDGQYQTAIGLTGGYRYPYISSDYGNTWLRNTGVNNSNRRNWTAVAISNSGQHQSAVTNGDKIYISNDYGLTWSAKQSNRSWMDISISNDAKCQTAIASSDYIYISHDSGNNWTPVFENIHPWKSVSMSEDGRYQSVVSSNSLNGVVYISSDSGLNWEKSSSPTGDWQDISLSSDGQIQSAILSNGTVHMSKDYGLSWNFILSRSVFGGGRGISISKDGKYQTAVGGYNIILQAPTIAITENSGENWTLIPLADNSSFLKAAISKDGKYQSIILPSPSTTAAVYTNCNFGKSGLPDFYSEKIGSIVSFNPSLNRFNLLPDYYLQAWGSDQEYSNILNSVPEKLINEPIIDIEASYNNNLAITKKNVELEFYNFPIEDPSINLGLLDNAIVEGAGIEILNGTYYFIRYTNGRPFYSTRREDPLNGNLISWSNAEWEMWERELIVGQPGPGLYKRYFSKNNTFYPWLVTQWSSILESSDPPPTVKIGSINGNIIIPECNGFIYDS